MGYTHYFTFKAPKGIKRATLEKAYQAAVLDCAKVAVAYNTESIFLDDRLAGYTAHTKPGTYGGIRINGKADNSHEEFILREHFNENMAEDFWGFCKTARKPYDTVVTACLAILKYYLGDAIDVSSDGRPEDWDAGVLLARRILKRAITNPLNPKVSYPPLKARKAA